MISGFLMLVYFIFMLLDGGIPANEGQILFDMLACGGGFIFWLMFFAQFTLPLQTTRHRLQAFLRLLYYVTGQAGPVVRVENGTIRERKAEREKNGPGVVILDTASAAMIRTPSEFTGPVGPGVYFTKRFETVAGTVDLHQQSGFIGPLEEEDPFAPHKIDVETEPEYKVRYERRFSTQGVTRDGIEVAPRIVVKVLLDGEKEEGATEFHYNAESVRKLITHSPVDPLVKADAPIMKYEPTALPLQLAADIWKECISRYTLEELFNNKPGGRTALQSIVAEMRERMTQRTYLQKDAVGRPGNTQRPSREYWLLKNRGVQVLGIKLLFLKFPSKVEDQIVAFWKSSWLIRAQREREYIDQLHSYERERGRRSAVTTYANRVTHYLGAQDLDARLNGDELMAQLIRGTLYLVEQESNVHRQAHDEMQQLKELLEWCEKRPEA